ncbi:DNA topoisomerase I [Coriobacteriia bacterium Es71-Z0120]|uniref:DNA topoisomerase I n=1 Tax=Parvivirga hydrogeniphila TaxID=2939460 RepID=UPI002260C7D6|nr:DNA topoisomerase I [Parvivirga hydrogeniphila]MCL4079305.1 DNA topoisomerase I [Parvivirga hydrogeniphila]
MRLIVSEKNIAARRIAEILATGKPKTEQVHGVPVYRFKRNGEEWASIGLKGHILGVDFPLALRHRDGRWTAEWPDGRATPAELPRELPAPPWQKRSKPYLPDGVDLATWKLQSLPYLVWAPVGKHVAERDIVEALKSLAKQADAVVIATDYDREGELIGADARSIVRSVNANVPIGRARFSAITKDEIERAFSSVGAIFEELAAAGETRQDIDLIWGAVLTRYLTKVKFSGVGRPRSVGRVQTPTLRLVVEREVEREAFVPETYWVVKALFEARGEEFSATHETERFSSDKDAARVLTAVDGHDAGTVAEAEKTRRTVNPPAPFNTTALQAAAAAEGLSPARTMRIAETLYMNGLISYPRVDNTVYPPSLDLVGALRMLREVPAYRDYAKRLLGRPTLRATRGAKETTDHPPIHPTGVADPDKLSAEEWKLYNLVARRFLATLSDPAVVEVTKLVVEVGGERFVARGDVVVEPGFREIYPYGAKRDERLPAVETGEQVAFKGASSESKQTQPPKRYTQGALIQEMEKRGLGTKATRHEIIQTLYDRGYITGDPVAPTSLGRAVVKALSAFAERITTPDMTAELEAEMDAIANGEGKKDAVVTHSRRMLGDALQDLLDHASEVGEMLKEASLEDARVGACPSCGKDLVVRSSAKTKGQFAGCTGYPECTVTYPLPAGKIEPVDEPCEVCGAPKIKVIQARRKPEVRCIDPACPTNAEQPLDIGACPVCAAAGRDGRIIAQRSARTLKRFARCTRYDECHVSYPLPQSGEIAPTGETCECGAPIVVVQTRRGPWRVCADPSCPSKQERPKRTGASRRRTRG